MCDKLWEHLQQLGVPPDLHYAIKVVHIVVYIKIWTNGNTHDEVMSEIGVKQGCPLSPIIFNLYIDELETYLDEINGDYFCLFNAILIFFFVLMMWFYSLNHEHAYKDFWTNYMSFALLLALELSKSFIMIFGHNKRKLNQEVFYLDKDQIEITHEYK